MVSVMSRAGLPPAPVPRAPAPDANVILQLLRRRWRVLAICTAISLVAGLVYLAGAKRRYTSSASLYVQPRGAADAHAVADPAFLNTQREIVASMPVAVIAINEIDAPSLKTFAGVDPITFLRNELRVQIGPRDELIRVAIESPDRDEAARIVNAIIDAYVKFQTGQQRATADRLLETLEKQRTDGNARAADLDRAIQAFYKESPALPPDAATAKDGITRTLADYRRAVAAAQLEVVDARVAYEEALIAWGNAPPPPAADGDATITTEEDQERIRGALVHAERELGLLQQKYLPQHPLVKDAAQRVADLKRDYLNATRRHLQIAGKREEHLRAAEASEERRAAELAQRAAQYAKLEAERRRLDEGTSVLAMRIKEAHVEAASASLAIHVLQPALPAAQPSYPRRRPALMLALAAGLIAGLGLAFVRQRTDPRFASAAELQATLAIPVIGFIPATSRTAGNLSPLNPLPLDRWSDSAEAARRLAAALDRRCPKGSAPALLVTSPRSGQGRSTIARDLAIALATEGRRVLLIDADYGHPSLHSLVGTRNTAGLSSVVTAAGSLEEAIVLSAIANLEVLPTGPAPSSPAAMFDSPGFESFLARVAALYDCVILDAAPILDGHDARIAAHACGAALLIAPAHDLNKRQLHESRDRLIGFGARIVGLVINDLPPRGRLVPSRPAPRMPSH
jgi:polysaccharide biosynthesis transport protein